MSIFLGGFFIGFSCMGLIVALALWSIERSLGSKR